MSLTARSFWMKLTLFLAPFALLLALYTGALVYIGESMPLPLVVALQSGDTPVLYRPQFGNRDVAFKALTINTRKPQVIAVGSSRVLQMRSGLFTEDPTVFYNAGAPAWTLTQVQQLLMSIQADAMPDVLILGLDAPWFNDAYQPDAFPPPINDLTNLFQQNNAVAQAALEGRTVNVDELLARREPAYGGLALGIKAIENGHGFRNDGSEQYGDFLIRHFLDQTTERARHLEWMRNGEQMYVYGDTVSENAITQLEAILDWCNAHGVMVIGFMPPYTPELYARMMKRGNHTYIEQLSSRLNNLFTEYDFAFFDFSDGSQFGTDEDFFDGWHGSERIELHVYEAMLAALPEVLGRYSRADVLQLLDTGAVDTWHVFGN